MPLHPIESVYGCLVSGVDGELGQIEDFLFDESSWRLRFAVLDAGHWLAGRKVLIPASALSRVDWEGRIARAALHRKEVREAGPVETFRWPFFWTGAGVLGIDWEAYGGEFPEEGEPLSRPSLRSIRSILGYNVQSFDAGEASPAGHVEDLVIDDAQWALRYLVVGLPGEGRWTLLSTEWIESVNWDLSRIRVSVAEEAILRAPGYVREQLITRRVESRLHSHFGRPGYWELSTRAA